MRHIMGLAIVLVAVVVLAVSVGMSRAIRPFKAEIVREENFSAEGLTNITASLLSGDITVTKSTGESIRVVMKVRARAHSQARADELVNMIKISAERSGQSLSLKPDRPKTTYKDDISIRLELFVPWSAGAAGAQPRQISLNTLSGDISIQGLAVNLTAGTASGDIKASGIDGAVQANSASGDVKVKDISGAVKLGSASGDIKASDIGGSLEGKTASGDIKGHDIGGSVLANSTSGDVKVSNVGGSFESKVVSGDIKVDSVTGTVSARTVSGDITVSNCKANVEASSVSGTVTK